MPSLSFDPATRTAEVTWTTGARVRRRGMFEEFDEELSLEEGAVDTSRMVGGRMPVLAAHSARRLADVIGVVESVWFTGTGPRREGRARIRFSDRDDVQPIVRDVEAGILRNVSVGYEVDAWQRQERKGQPPVMRAAKWRPLEISLVPIPADGGAFVRTTNTDLRYMTVETSKAPEDSAPAHTLRFTRNGAPVVEPAAARTAAAEAEADRVATILERAAKLGCLEHAAGYIRSGATVEQAVNGFFDIKAAEYDATAIRNINPYGHGTGIPTPEQRRAIIAAEGGADYSDPAFQRGAMEEALFCRATGRRPSDQARAYMNLRTLDMARELLRGAGVRSVDRMGPDSVLERAMQLRTGGLHTTSDFTQLLTGTGNRILGAAYAAAESPLKTLARSTTLADFRAKSSLRISGMGRLPEVLEHGEIERKTRSETKESYRLRTFGSIFGITRNAIINDDLSAFEDWGRVSGRAVAETEAAELAALLLANSGNGVTMDDGVPWHHSVHGNKAASGGAIDTTTLSAARLAMRGQKDSDGVTPIAVTPRYLLVSPALETAAETMLATLASTTVAEVNPFAGRLQLLVDVHLSGNAWWVFASPDQLPTLEYAYLSSAPGPQLSTREGWDVLGVEMRCVFDFGCGVQGYAGSYLNPGAS